MTQNTEVGNADVPVSVIKMFLKTEARFHLRINSPNESYTLEAIKCRPPNTQTKFHLTNIS